MAQELKAYGMDDPEVGDEYEMYKVSEVDAVLAEKDAENESLLQQNRELCQALQVMYSKEEYDKQKHKRCLANAEICCEKKENCYNRALRKYSKDEADYLVRKSDFWQDWEFRWLKIAEKFKSINHPVG